MKATPALLASFAFLALAGCSGQDSQDSREVVAAQTLSNIDSPYETADSEGATGTSAAENKTNRISSSEPVKRKSISSLYLQKLRRFKEPVYVTQARGDRSIFVVEKRGVVWQKKNGRWKKLLDIRGRVKNDGEQGLLSAAFSPSWKNDGLFYLYYTARSGKQIVAEAERKRGQAKIRRIILSMDDFASNHNGGALQYYKGLLYIATGDGGGGGDPERTSQNKNSLLGKILRIDPRSPGGYIIPKGNPYAGGGGRPEIFALGLRNPWRFSFGKEKIWIADVGQDAFEEVNSVSVKAASGANFGWSAYEGNKRYNDDQKAAPHTKPIWTYGRNRGCSITGGYLVQNKNLSSLYGKYIYGDLCKKNLRALVVRGGEVKKEQILPLKVEQLVSFGEGRGGKIWAVSILGDIYEIKER